MNRKERKIEKNLDDAYQWLDRANKDFQVFKRLAPFDRRTHKVIRCSDPSLAVYLLQQSIEKAVKAAAIASGQYKPKSFRNYYRHNSLALILNLNQKMLERVSAMGLKPISDLMGIDLIAGDKKIGDLERLVMGDKVDFRLKTEDKVDVRQECVSLPSNIIDAVLDMILQSRSQLLDIIHSAYAQLPKLGIRSSKGTVEDPEAFLQQLSELVVSDLNIKSPSGSQLQGAMEFLNRLNIGKDSKLDELGRTDNIELYLGIWSFSLSLYLLTYLTFAHDTPSRYPRDPGSRASIKYKSMGFEDYDESLGIVNRLGRIGYVTSLTLNDLKQQLEAITVFFEYDTFPK